MKSPVAGLRLGTTSISKYWHFHENLSQSEEGKAATLQCLTWHPFQTKTTGYDVPYPLELASYKFENGRHMVALTKSSKEAPTEYLWIELYQTEPPHWPLHVKLTTYRGRMTTGADTFTASWDKILYHHPGGSEWTNFTFPGQIRFVRFAIDGAIPIDGKTWLQIGNISEPCVLKPSHPLPYKGLWVPLTDEMGVYNVADRFVAC